MPKYSVFLHKKALKQLEELQQDETKSEIKKSIESLIDYPLSLRQMDVQKLEGFERAFRIRVGRFRVFFSVDKASRSVYVTKIEKRESAYE
ncbi:MAG: type II toxin-antitoxin system RelE family toxin [Nitrososphaerales archaeon]